MTDRDEQVRRLLSDLRHDEPMPADVAARLDAVIADLGAGTDPSGAPDVRAPAPAATVVADRAPDDLASARRRRKPWGGIALVAAAGVVVAALATGQVGPLGGSPDVASSGAGVSRESAGGQADGSALSEAAPPDAAGDSAPQTQAGSASAAPFGSAGAAPVQPELRALTLEERFAAGGAPVIRPDRFAADVHRALEKLARSSAAVPGDTGVKTFACGRADWGTGTLLPVTYQGAFAVLALRPPTGDTQVADLLSCGTADVIRSVTLPTR